MNKQLARIREAYDLTVKEHRDGRDPLAKVPHESRKSNGPARSYHEGLDRTAKR